MNIQGYSDLLQTDELSKEERLQYAAIIQRESKRLSNLTKQLLILTSLDQATYSLQRNSVRLDEQLKEVIRKSQWRINERELELSYKVEPVSIQGDAELLMSVWDNLLSNAIKYSEVGSIISITCREIHDEIQITFKDTGIGINNEQLIATIYPLLSSRYSKKERRNGTRTFNCQESCGVTWWASECNK